MRIVVQVKLLPTPEEASALERTLHAANEAANWLSAEAYGQGEQSRKALQSFAYSDLKERGLSAQPALHVLRKVADAYTALRANIRAGNLGTPGSKRRRKAESQPLVFRLDAAQPYDDRCLSWQLDEQTISIWTVSGRMRGVRYVCSERSRRMLAGYRKGESDLVHRNGAWFLIATCEVSEAAQIDPVDFLGVDLGIVNIATTSDGKIHAGRRLNRYRRRQLALRAKLQKKGTKSAKRVLKRQRRKESRKATEANHIISKRIVTVAERTGRGIALEDLKGIRERARLRKPQRVALHSWAFAQLGQFVEYKARRAGIPVLFVDPAYTSRRCAECGHADKANRVSQARFVCRSCGVVAHADRNASRNIRARARELWRRGAESHAPAPA
ncbi:IS200/IS605 family element transposase accessory protein TnpB [Streptomyces rectiverticillatus]|uniref:RNA-guided endonuclease InsQ/TnpB family protein n=1 Tax=Streptomyces rectiverticillatus TaxID=173860 RepID=UPI0015C38336|nr:RNA-guided endonuclease TnpB family protein [Streptomyces rectiverticillatus]QLE75374.1 IS200/IS605 family element transposase accessory protein TnpB [Streptomyces rectiverticillatus]